MGYVNGLIIKGASTREISWFMRNIGKTFAEAPYRESVRIPVIPTGHWTENLDKEFAKQSVQELNSVIPDGSYKVMGILQEIKGNIELVNKVLKVLNDRKGELKPKLVSQIEEFEKSINPNSHLFGANVTPVKERMAAVD